MCDRAVCQTSYNTTLLRQLCSLTALTNAVGVKVSFNSSAARFVSAHFGHRLACLVARLAAVDAQVRQPAQHRRCQLRRLGVRFECAHQQARDLEKGGFEQTGELSEEARL